MSNEQTNPGTNRVDGSTEKSDLTSGDIGAARAAIEGLQEGAGPDRIYEAVQAALKQKDAENAAAARAFETDPIRRMAALSGVVPWGEDVYNATVSMLEAREAAWDSLAENPNYDPTTVALAKDLSDRQLYEVIDRAATLTNDEGVLTPVYCTVWKQLVEYANEAARPTWKRGANLHIDTLGAIVSAAAKALVNS